jgi:GT2 family glycosyltransferase
MISVIMPIYRHAAATRQALRAVAAADELIVVVDGGDAQVVALAQEVGATVMTLPVRSGPAVARNAGARVARGDIFFFVDSDVLITPQTLPAIRRAFTNPALTALIGSYDDAPADPAFLSQYRNLLHHFIHQQSGGEAYTFWGACGAVRREPFLAVGGFDESYPHPSIEDIALGYRLRAAGYRLRLDPTLQVRHLKRWTAGKMLHTDLLRRALPWSRLILAGDGFKESLNIGRQQRISVALAFLLLPAIWHSRRGGVAVFMGIVWLNRPFYRFLWRKRGTYFLLKALFWHWLYFLCSGIGFLCAYGEHSLKRLRNVIFIL